jgi:transposase
VQIHANAKLVPSTRLLLVRRVLEEHWKVGDVAVAFGISERTVYRWLARWRAGDRRLLDRSSAPRRVPRRAPRALEVLIERLRRLRMTSTRIAAELEMAVSTGGAVLKRLGLNRLSRLEPPEPPNRYERRRPGELIHLDIKKLGRFRRPGHRVTGRAAPGVHANRGHGWDCVHVAVDDYSRVAYVEILNDERGETCAGFLTLSHRLVPRTDRARRTGDQRQRLRLPLTRLRPGLHPSPRASPTNASLPTAHQWQSRTLHPNPPTRMGLRGSLRNQPPPHPGSPTMDRLLQPPTTPRRPQPPSTHHAATHRLTNVPGIYN